MDNRYYFYRLDEQKHIIPEPITIPAMLGGAIHHREYPTDDARQWLQLPDAMIEFHFRGGVTFNALQEPIYGIRTPLVSAIDFADDTQPFVPYSTNPHLPMFYFAFMAVSQVRIMDSENSTAWLHAVVPCIRAVREVRIPIAPEPAITEHLVLDVMPVELDWVGLLSHRHYVFLQAPEPIPLAEIIRQGKSVYRVVKP